MRHLRFSVLVLLALSLACDLSNPFSNSPTSTVTMAVAFPQHDNQDVALNKAMNIVDVRVRVFADDMDEVNATLTMSHSGEQASGTVEVPKGDARTFHVTLRDENQVLQYEGQDVFDIVNDDESIQMDVFGIRPDAVDLSIGVVSSVAVGLNWTRAQANDFAEYMIIRTETPNISQDPEIVRRIFLRSNQSYLDSTILQNTDYYYAILTIDTEGLFEISPVRGAHTARRQELAYHDNVAEDFIYGSVPEDRCEVEFTSPYYPCYIRAIRLKLRDQSGFDGNYRIYVEDVQTENELFYSEPLATNPATNSTEGDWVTWLFNWGNRTQGIVNGDFYAGIEYTSDRSWPDIFLDTSINQFRSYFYDAGSEMWFDVIGNYLMSIIIEIGGGPLSKGISAGTENHDRLIPVVSLARAGELTPLKAPEMPGINWANPEITTAERAVRPARP